MIPATRHVPWALWAARNLQRHSGRSILLFACLAGLVFLASTALLFSQALDATWAGLVDRAPDLVVRRIDAGGWAPLPVEEAVACAKTIPGVLNPTPRLWGVLAGTDGPLTVVTATATVPQDVLKGINPPSPGQAVVGLAVTGAAAGSRLELEGRQKMSFDVIATFPADSGLATHDLVWLTPDDARRLLGLMPGQASDLAIHLFHREEEQAIQADLAAAFPWPVRITDRSTVALSTHTRAVRTGGMALVAVIPALLAFLLIIAGTVADSAGQRTHWGLLKAMGWTTTDIVRLQTTQALIVGVPAVALGLAAAYAAVFVPPVAGITAFWVTGGQHLPALTLNGSGTILAMVQIAVLAVLPYLATVFITTVHGAANAPLHLFHVGPWN